MQRVSNGCNENRAGREDINISIDPEVGFAWH